jgi:hypothetical protein
MGFLFHNHNLFLADPNQYKLYIKKKMVDFVEVDFL